MLSVFAESTTGESDWMSVVVSIGESKIDVAKIATMSCQTIAVPENQKITNIKRIIAAGTPKNASFSIKS